MDLWTVPLAYLIDSLLGDPRQITHPVILIGRWISACEKLVYLRLHTPLQRRIAGALVVLSTVAVSYCATWGLVWIAYLVHPALGWGASAWLIATTIAQKSLAQAADKVRLALQQGQIGMAREYTQQIVGRDTMCLDEPELVRAAVETVAENTVDGVTAPVFYALLGGAPLAMAYRAVNTLDSMLGYKNERYIDFGWAAARLDDAANYVPARLTGVVLPLAAGLCSAGVIRTAQTIVRDARQHPSPNSGIPEAGFAGALDVTLGGRNVYAGQVSYRALMGTGTQRLRASHISQSIRLMQVVSFVFLVLVFALRRRIG